METEFSGDALRALAPCWSLAGDEKLLNILQNTHKKILTKCKEVNSKLEQMTAALDETSISLQNVNNKFLALSNSQFIESRVYDDDADISTDTAPTVETPQKPHTQELDLEAIKNSLHVLQNHHESVTILKDSDTETDSDGEDGDRVVLKPKDLYSDRPLPYIIGSEAWKNSWHAGLIPEDSDSESGSGGREPPSPQYSDSEPEDTQVASKANATISETSSDIASEQDMPMPLPKSTPADIAADLARRLGAQHPKMKEADPEYSPAKTVAKTIYKPQQPQTGTIFTDEPPPLDAQSESSEEDIFAELNSNRPKIMTGEDERFESRVFPDEVKIAPQPRNEQRPLFEDDPDEFEERPPPVKKIEKPVGGISVFGTNKRAESIGAAILKRNQRKSTSEEDTDSEERSPPPKPKAVDQTDSIRKEKDIFDDLFAKSAYLEKKKQVDKDKNSEVKRVAKDRNSEVKSVAKDKVDLFSDNLFDDVNDLFTTNVMKNKNNQKSIFDDDDDDLFADIAISVNAKENDKSNEAIGKNKNIFDSDDELFADKSPVTSNMTKESAGVNPTNNKSNFIGNKNIDITKVVTNSENPTTSIIDVAKPIISNQSNIKSTSITKNIFDSDSDSDIFSNFVKKDTESKGEKKDIFDVKEKNTDAGDIFKTSHEIKKDMLKIGDEISKMRSPSLFDDDEDDELFNDSTSKNVENTGALRENAIGATDIVISKEAVKSITSIPEKTDVVENTFPSFVKEVVKSEPSEDFSSEDKNDLFESDIPTVPSDNNSRKQNIFVSKRNEQNNSHLTSENKETKAQDNETLIRNEIESELETNKPLPPIVDDIFVDEDSLFKIEKNPISKDIFDDEPPVFEKPKEPKRSKNVNALFDDDSEDEALFFRKSDMDDKSDNFTSAVKSDQLFGIFHDEPPAIDNVEDDSDIFQSVSKSSIEDGKAKEFNKAGEKLHDFENVPPSDSIKNIPENEVDHANVSLLETKSTAKYNYDNNDLFKIDKAVSEIIENKNKSLNIHDAFSEIKEDEFDDIFKAANKVVNVDNSDIFEVTIDDYINKTESQNNQNDNIFSDTGISTSQLPEDVPASMKPGIEIDSDEELFRTLPKPEMPKVPEISPSDELDKGALLTKHDKIDISNKLKEEDILKSIGKVEDMLEKSEKVQPDDFTKTSEKILKHKPELTMKEHQSKNADNNKVGKIKSLNLNIDVSALLPGASPKKQKLETPKDKDWEPVSDSPSEEVSKRLTPENVSKIMKSISFEGEPNSEVLDNKLSKERARIQVKRRPSTRRARREAVRKSAIDFDDSTDNSSSIDDPPKTVNKLESPSKTIDFKTVSTESSSNILNTDVKDSKTDTKDVMVSKIEQVMSKDKHIATDNAPEKPKVTSKVVYILNDEDIFNTKPDDEVDLFKKDTPIPTLGNMYAEVTKTETKPIVSDNIKKLSKVGIFGSDSEEELFGGKSKDKKKVEVKGSLFGYEDDDDDLFGVKSKKADFTKPQTSSNVSKEIEKSEPVFNDPLSMLDDDE